MTSAGLCRGICNLQALYGTVRPSVFCAVFSGGCSPVPLFPCASPAILSCQRAHTLASRCISCRALRSLSLPCGLAYIRRPHGRVSFPKVLPKGSCCLSRAVDLVDLARFFWNERQVRADQLSDGSPIHPPAFFSIHNFLSRAFFMIEKKAFSMSTTPTPPRTLVPDRRSCHPGPLTQACGARELRGGQEGQGQP